MKELADARCAWTHMTDDQRIEFLEWIGAERECIHGDVEYIIPLAAFAPELPEELT